MEKRRAHVIDASGVTETPFKHGPDGWTNEEEITLKPGSVLDFGGGLTLANPAESPTFTYRLEPGP
jgi:hypothetical protein